MTSFNRYSLGAAAFLFYFLHPAHNSVSGPVFKSVGLDSGFCMTDIACNSS